MKLGQFFAGLFALSLHYNISQTENVDGKLTTVKENPAGERSAVKLNMKQGIIMNQVLDVYSLKGVENQLCKNHNEELKNGLRAFEPWALQMFDSSSKLMSGILNGNLDEMGSFEQCLAIYKNTHYGPLRGRHCVFKITPTDYLIDTILSYRNISKKYAKLLRRHVLDGAHLTWSVCVPDSCRKNDIFPHFSKVIREFSEGLNLTVDLQDDNCISLDDLPEISTGDYIYIISIGCVVFIVVICSIFDRVSGGPSNCFIDSFSIIQNGKRLVSTRKIDGELTCINGIRFISACYVILGHRFINNLVTPHTNGIYISLWLPQWFSTIEEGASFIVDTFFVIGSVVLSYRFFGAVKKSNRFNIFLFYIWRHVNLAPPIIVTIGAYATVAKHFGTGPLYHTNIIGGIQKDCQEYWWSAIFNVQYLFNPSAMCIVQTWYLSVDMALFYLSPAILVPFWKYPKFGIVNFVCLYSFFVFLCLYIAWVNEFDGGMPITPLLFEKAYFQKFYVQPHCRAPVYILGLGLGYVLYETRESTVRMSQPLLIFGWSVSALCLVASIVGSHYFFSMTYEYNRVYSSLYLAFSRSVFSIGLIWVIWCCVKGYGGPVDFILSHDVFKILSRLGYFMFLLHYLLQSTMQSAVKSPEHFSNFLTIRDGIADVVICTYLSLVLTLFFEFPFTRILRTVLGKIEQDKKKVDPKI